MIARRSTATLVALALAVLAPSAAAATADARATARAASWLAANSAGAPAGQQADAIVALRAAGRSERSLKTRLARLGRSAPAYARTAGGAAKVVMAAVAAGGDPRRLAGVDYVRRITSRYASGRYGATVFDQALSMLAIEAAGGSVPRSAARATLAGRGTGGWSFDLERDGRDSVDATALVIEALVAAGVPRRDARLRAGARWMLAQRNREGDWRLPAAVVRPRPTPPPARCWRYGPSGAPRPTPPALRSGGSRIATAASASRAPRVGAACSPPPTR